MGRKAVWLQALVRCWFGEPRKSPEHQHLQSLASCFLFCEDWLNATCLLFDLFFFPLAAVIISDLEILLTNRNQTICLQDTEKGEKKDQRSSIKIQGDNKAECAPDSSYFYIPGLIIPAATPH